MREPFAKLMRRAGISTILATSLSLATVTPATAQSRPFGTEPEQNDIRTVLGECPVEALRAGWAELDALQAVAIEAEVLELCTQRDETINRMIARHIQLEAAVAGLRAPTSQPAPPPGDTITTASDSPAPTPAITALRAEIAALRQRIDDLEESPGEAATLPPLREALARKEEELADAVAHEASTNAPEIPASAPEPTIALPSVRMPATDPADTDIPEPETGEIQPSNVETSPWQIVWTARQGEDPWKAGFARITRRWVSVPSDDPDTPPSGAWTEDTEGPFVASVNDCLPDGSRVFDLFPEDGQGFLVADPTCPQINTAGLTDRSEPAEIAFDVRKVVTE